MRGVCDLRRISITVATLLWSLVMVGSTSARVGFGLPVEGSRTVVISDRVGQNQVRFVSSAPLEEIYGTASDVTGRFTFDPADLSGLAGVVRVKVLSMETGIDRRDEHLFSRGWLDAKTHPEILFEIKGLKDMAPASAADGRSVLKGTAVGAFTLHGVTKDLEAAFEATYIRESEATARRAPGDLLMVKSSFRIALKDYDISGVRGLVGSKVGKTIDVDVSLFGSTTLTREEE